MGVDSRTWRRWNGGTGTGDRRGRERRGIPAVVHCAVACAIALASCAARPQVTEREVRMRYVNLNLIFEYMVRSDPDAQKVRRRKEDLLGSAKKLEAELAGADESRRQTLARLLSENRSGLEEVRSAEELQKQRLLGEINRVLEAVGARMEIDYIFNLGDALVYGKKEYDITETVLNEIIALRKRNAPVSR
jgi:Skp family chaperone for outer membrane proteins